MTQARAERGSGLDWIAEKKTECQGVAQGAWLGQDSRQPLPRGSHGERQREIGRRHDRAGSPPEEAGGRQGGAPTGGQAATRGGGHPPCQRAWWPQGPAWSGMCGSSTPGGWGTAAGGGKMQKKGERGVRRRSAVLSRSAPGRRAMEPPFLVAHLAQLLHGDRRALARAHPVQPRLQAAQRLDDVHVQPSLLQGPARAARTEGRGRRARGRPRLTALRWRARTGGPPCGVCRAVQMQPAPTQRPASSQ